jgi:hypothetical protein
MMVSAISGCLIFITGIWTSNTQRLADQLGGHKSSA